VSPERSSTGRLTKAGAELVGDALGLYPHYEILESREAFGEEPLFFYVVRCQLLQRGTNAIVCEGMGSCSSENSRYKWRRGDRKCPECGSSAIMKSKYDDGWFCFKKRDGCGAKFHGDDPKIVEQTVGRVVNPDLADCANTILKMAMKSARVSASLDLGLSDLFSQDPEAVQTGAKGYGPPADDGRPSPGDDRSIEELL
jgi:hypothetical protein